MSLLMTNNNSSSSAVKVFLCALLSWFIEKKYFRLNLSFLLKELIPWSSCGSCHDELSNCTVACNLSVNAKCGAQKALLFFTNRTKIKILNYGQTKEVNQNVSTRSGRGDADPSFLLFFQENLLSCTFFIAFLNPAFCFQNIKVKKILNCYKS